MSNKTVDLESCALLIRSMPIDQAIQYIKSKLSGLPETQVIGGRLVVKYIKE